MRPRRCQRTARGESGTPYLFPNVTQPCTPEELSIVSPISTSRREAFAPNPDELK